MLKLHTLGVLIFADFANFASFAKRNTVGQKRGITLQSFKGKIIREN